LLFKDILFPPHKLIVALTNFHLVSGAEVTDNNALISHLQDSLNVYKKDIELRKSVCPEVRDSSQARKLGEKVGAHIVIWGSIEKTSLEAEIIPHITIVRPLGKLKLEARQPQRMTISLARLDQIEFKERKARQITDAVLFILGLAKYELNKYQEAIQVFESIQNKNAEILLYIGNGYSFLPKPDFLKAATAYEMTVQMDSNLAQAYCNWGAALGNLGGHEEATGKFMEALRLNPNDDKAYFNWGVCLMKLGKNEEAIEKFREALRLNPDHAESYYNWGVALLNLKKNEEAIEKYKETARLDPKYDKAYYNWGLALGSLGRYEEATEKLERAIQINPKFAKAHRGLGATLIFLDRKEEAKKEFLTALELFRKQGRDEDVRKVEELLKELEGK
jgi:tetratricopeptide (TPR) repeat protein